MALLAWSSGLDRRQKPSVAPVGEHGITAGDCGRGFVAPRGNLGVGWNLAVETPVMTRDDVGLLLVHPLEDHSPTGIVEDDSEIFEQFPADVTGNWRIDWSALEEKIDLGFLNCESAEL